MLLVTILLLFFLVLSLKENNLYDFNVSNTLSLRGGLAALIVAAHLAQWFDFSLYTPHLLQQFTLEIRGSAKFVVATFFCLSAYGSLSSYEKKVDNYLVGFLKKKALRLFVPLVPIVFIFQSYKIATGTFSLIEIIRGLAHGGTINLCPNIWYVFSIYFYYIVFFLTAKKTNNAKIITAITFLAYFLLSVYSFYDNWGEHWFISNLGLTTGSIIYCHKKDLSLLLSKHAQLGIMICIISLIIICLMTIIDGRFQVISCAIIPFIVYIAICRGRRSNKAFDWLGKYSYEIYICHGALISIFGKVNNPWLFLLITLSTIPPIAVFSRQFTIFCLKSR